MEPDERAEGMVGGAVWAAWITGFLGLAGFLVAAVTLDWAGAGLCLIAAAVAFTGVARAILAR